MKFKLNFDLETSTERCAYLSTQNLSDLSPKFLEMCADYIIYGKDPEHDFTSSVDRKEIQIKSKYDSYNKKEPVSLDALLESPTFNEALLNPKPTIYKNYKPIIDKDKTKNIPGMKELWEQIDGLQRIVDQNSGKIEFDDGQSPLSSKEFYHLKHQLIDIRRQQYYLLDSVYPTRPAPQNKGKYFDNVVDLQMNYRIYPRGLMRSEFDIEFKEPFRSFCSEIDKTNNDFSNKTLNKNCKKPNLFAANNLGNKQEREAAANSKLDISFNSMVDKPVDIEKEIDELEQRGRPYFNFLNKDHVYQLILAYWDIRMEIKNVPDSPLWGLLWTLDWYIEKANLSEQQLLIVRDKKLRVPNKEIVQHLQEELGIYHQENYISTIWNKICQTICDAAALNWDEWLCKDYKKAWKKCSCCGKWMLRDTRNFVRKTKALDGLTGRCKRCDKMLRQK